MADDDYKGNQLAIRKLKKKAQGILKDIQALAARVRRQGTRGRKKTKRKKTKTKKI